MEVVYQRCAGLDVGKDEVVACVRVPAGAGGRRQEVRTYPTFTSGLYALADWRTEQGITQVVLEATGQYLKPVWYVLEEHRFELMLVNAGTSRSCPAVRPTSATRRGCAGLVECGLLRSSFVPPPQIRRLRDLVRYRKRLIQPHTAECQRIHKTLEAASIRLGSVAADVLGSRAGRCWPRCWPASVTQGVLAGLARGRLRTKLPQLRQALRGRFSDHHALLLRLALEHVTPAGAVDRRTRRGGRPGHRPVRCGP